MEKSSKCESHPAGRQSASGQQQLVDRDSRNHGSLVPQAPLVLATSAHAACARDTERKSTILTNSPMNRVIRSRDMGPIDWDSLLTTASGPAAPFAQEVFRPLSPDPEAVQDTDAVMEDRLTVATVSSREVASRASSELERRLQSGNLAIAKLEADAQRTGTVEGLMYKHDEEGGHGLGGTFRKRPDNIYVSSESEDERRCCSCSSQGSDEGNHKKKSREGSATSSPSAAIAWQPLPLPSPKTPPSVMKIELPLVTPWAPRKPRGGISLGPGRRENPSASSRTRTSTKTRRQLRLSELQH